MKLQKIHRISVNIILILFITLFCLSSCSVKAEQKSLTAQFETIDALIRQNQFKDAVKELKKLEKKAFDSWSYIGIYKRYSLMGNKELSEKILLKALKNNNENLELLAIYSDFLLKNNRIDEAVEKSKSLKGTRYGSIYSEAVLTKSARTITEMQNNLLEYYKNDKFYEIYLDAYKASKNPIWLRNCAVYDMTKGYYSEAVKLLPYAFSDADDAYFWALVNYDAGRFYESIDAIEESQKFLNGVQNKNIYKVNEVQQTALQSDCFLAVSESVKAEKVRQNVIINLENINLRKTDDLLLPVIMTNSAMYAKSYGNMDSCADLLFSCVNHWPDFAPALIMYSDFAYESNLEREEDAQIKALRNAGISSLEMDRYDSRRKIPLSDALYRLDSSIKRTGNPYLIIKKQDLRYKTDKSLTDGDKNRDLWILLEDNDQTDSEYKLLLIQYALNYLLTTKQYNEAWTIYSNYLNKKIQFDEKKDFWDQVIGNLKNLDFPLVEFSGWFAADSKLLEESKKIYEYCVFEGGNKQNDLQISPAAAMSALLNMADIYYSTGDSETALKLYGKAAGRQCSNRVRSDIYYRIAKVYFSTGDINSGKKAAEYAKELYPENIKAALLILNSESGMGN